MSVLVHNHIGAVLHYDQIRAPAQNCSSILDVDSARTQDYENRVDGGSDAMSESLYSCHSACFITRQTEMHRLSSSKLVKKYNGKRACIDPEPTIHDEPASLTNHLNPAPPTY